MADLARIARPSLLLASLLRQQQQPGVFVRSPAAASRWRLGRAHGVGLGGGGARGISATAARLRTPPPKTRGQHERERDTRKKAQPGTANNFLLPFTIVPPRLWRYPLSPVKALELAWTVFRNRLRALGGTTVLYAMSSQSKSGGRRKYSMPRFRSGKRAAVPAAKALHAQMSEAVAAADKDTLRRICSPQLFQTLAGAIDARPPRLRTVWELVRYDRRPWYPRVADFRVTWEQGPGGGAKGGRILKQVVVSIASVQRLTRYDDADGGRAVPGTGVDRRMLEHLVLQADVAGDTWESGPWKVWGTLSEMDLETIRSDETLLREAIDDHARSRARV